MNDPAAHDAAMNAPAMNDAGDRPAQPPPGVAARWALVGKRRGDVGEYHLLASSGDESQHGEFDRAVHALVAGNPDAGRHGSPGSLPWVSFAPEPDGTGAPGARRLAVAVAEPAGHTDAFGRSLAQIRYFDIPLPRKPGTRWSYAAFHGAVAAAALPPGDPGPLRLLIAESNLDLDVFARESAGVLAWCLHLAGLLVDGPVVVTGGDLEVADRLAVLDTVTALLPAWTRAEVSASTWADLTDHRLRLVFGALVGDGQTQAPLMETPDLPEDSPGRSYVRTLSRLCEQLGAASVAEHLASLAEPPPQSESRPGLAWASADATGFAMITDFAADIRAARSPTPWSPTAGPGGIDLGSADLGGAAVGGPAPGTTVCGHLERLAGVLAIVPADRWPPGDYETVRAAVDECLGSLPPDTVAAWWKQSAALGAAPLARFEDRVVETALYELAGGRHAVPAALWRAAAVAGREAEYLGRLLVDVFRGGAYSAARMARGALVAMLRGGAPDLDALRRIRGLLWREEAALARLIAVEADEAYHSMGAYPEAGTERLAACVRSVTETAGGEAGPVAPAWLLLLGPLARPRRAGAPSVEVPVPDLETLLPVWAVARLLSGADGVVAATWRRFAALLSGRGSRLPDGGEGPDLRWAVAQPFGVALAAPTRATADVVRILSGLPPVDLPLPVGRDEGLLEQYLNAFRTVYESEQFARHRPVLLESGVAVILKTFPDKLPRCAADLLAGLHSLPAEDLGPVAKVIKDQYSGHPGLARGLLKRNSRQHKGLWSALDAAYQVPPRQQTLISLKREAAGYDRAADDSSGVLDELAARMAEAYASGWPSLDVARALRDWDGRSDPVMLDRLLDLYARALLDDGVRQPLAVAEAAADEVRRIAAGGKLWRDKHGDAFRAYRTAVLEQRRRKLILDYEECQAKIESLSHSLEAAQWDLKALALQITATDTSIDALARPPGGD